MRQGTSVKRVALVGIGVAVMVAALAVAPANAALVGYWKMDETSGVTASDASLHGHPGELKFGAAWDSAGHSNGAVSLTSVAHFVQVADAADLRYDGGNMTLSAWVYINPSEMDGGNVISKPWNGAGRYNYRLTVGGGATDIAVGFYLANGDWTNPKDAGIGTAAILSKGGWHHLAAVVDSSRNMKLYVDATDGIADAVGVHNIMNFSPTIPAIPLALGTLFPYGDGPSFQNRTGFTVDGKLDDVAIFDCVLEGSQIAALAAGWASPLTVVPEPTTGAILGSGLILAGLLAAARRRRTPACRLSHPLDRRPHARPAVLRPGGTIRRRPQQGSQIWAPNPGSPHLSRDLRTDFP